MARKIQEQFYGSSVPIHNYAQISVQQLPEAKRKLEIPDVTALSNTYTVTNATPLRIFDVSTATPTDTLNALAALIADLKTAGILPP